MTQPSFAEARAELQGWSARRSDHLRPDGTPVTVYVQFRPDGTVVSDLGGTLLLLRRLPPLARFAVRDTCRRNDVQIDRGTLLVHVPPGGDVGAAVDRLGRVCAAVSRAGR